MSGNTKAPLLVHIGYHKTATSFLQSRVFSDPRIFSQPWGAQSAQAVEWFVLAHPQRFSPDAVRRDFLDRLAAGDDTVPVISQEALSGKPVAGRYYAAQVAARIHQTFPEARIVIGIREQKKLLASLYYQFVKAGGADPITRFVQAPDTRIGFRPRVRFDHFEYDLMLQIYRAYWAPEDILILPMELLQNDRDLYIERLLDFAGQPGAEIAPATSVNKRRANVTMRMERFFNRVLPPPDPRPERYSDYPLAHRLKNRSLRTLEGLGPVARMGQAEHDRIVAHIDATVGDYFSTSNQRLAAMTDLDLGALGYV